MFEKKLKRIIRENKSPPTRAGNERRLSVFSPAIMIAERFCFAGSKHIAIIRFGKDVDLIIGGLPRHVVVAATRALLGIERDALYARIIPIIADDSGLEAGSIRDILRLS